MHKYNYTFLLFSFFNSTSLFSKDPKIEPFSNTTCTPKEKKDISTCHLWFRNRWPASMIHHHVCHVMPFMPWNVINKNIHANFRKSYSELSQKLGPIFMTIDSAPSFLQNCFQYGCWQIPFRFLFHYYF